MRLARLSTVWPGAIMVLGSEIVFSGESPHPSPTSKSHCAKAAFSGDWCRHIFYVKWKTWICLQTVDLRMEALIICSCEPLGITGKICWKSPSNRTVRPPKGQSCPSTVGLKTIAMFGHFGLIVMQCLTAWKLHLALLGWSKVLLLGFLSVFYS